MPSTWWVELQAGSIDQHQRLLEGETDCLLAWHRLHQVIWIDDTCCKEAKFPQKPLLECLLAETGASAKSVWLIATDAPLQVFRVRSLVPGLEGQTIAPVPHKIAHSCIFNEASGQMVWNDIIQCLAVLRQRKSSASTTMPLYLRGEGVGGGRCPSAQLTSAPLHSPTPQDHLGSRNILGTRPIHGWTWA